MANEDCNNNSVLGDALKMAAVGYAAYKGGKGLVKHYDDLGSTFLGEKIGNSMTNGINKALDVFDGKGGNAVREGVDKLQGKVLDRDFKKGVNKMDSMLNKDGFELSQSNIDGIHAGYNKSSTPAEKRDAIKNIKSDYNELKDLRQEHLEAFGDDGIKAFKNTLAGDESFSTKGTRASANAESNTQKL